MKAIRLQHPSRLDTMRLIDLPNPGEPGPGEIRVRLHASSLNYHDLGVVTGKMPEARASIPMSDGAGIVEAVGPGVTELAAGDQVVSTFFLNGSMENRRLEISPRRPVMESTVTPVKSPWCKQPHSRAPRGAIATPKRPR